MYGSTTNLLGEGNYRGLDRAADLQQGNNSKCEFKPWRHIWHSELWRVYCIASLLCPLSVLASTLYHVCFVSVNRIRIFLYLLSDRWLFRSCCALPLRSYATGKPSLLCGKYWRIIVHEADSPTMQMNDFRGGRWRPDEAINGLYNFLSYGFLLNWFFVLCFYLDVARSMMVP
ncbi:hypothetical protein B0I35DRAFT_238370 [Stachybotrys elegans]|uniref:Uncharacterized protein n=1 Tax=Stachybotrys elegans TaxID=80388 RepID=A0A8K0WQL8_9HYPO|nr:hypothetical protein B0I35DRAFT_238370 [Stachybotrys elegans]